MLTDQSTDYVDKLVYRLRVDGPFYRLRFDGAVYRIRVDGPAYRLCVDGPDYGNSPPTPTTLTSQTTGLADGPVRMNDDLGEDPCQDN